MRSRSVYSTHSGATSSPSPTSRTTCSSIATGNQQDAPADVARRRATAKSTSTGSEKRNSIPLLSTIRLTQIDRGIAVDRTSRASLLNARVKSDTEELNQTHGSSARDEEDDVRLLARRCDGRPA